MTKTIVFCADGTWNGPGADDARDPSAHPTNVLKLFNRLLGTNPGTSPATDVEQEKLFAGDNPQIAKYLHGVGNSHDPLEWLLGGAAGAGIVFRIVRGYTFISREYEAGAKIVLTGFSRGAYTARALAGLIAARGLLDRTAFDPNDKEIAYRKGAAVWYDWRKAAPNRPPGWLGRLAEAVSEGTELWYQDPLPALIPGVPIEAVAVWDTVGALGIPLYTTEDTRADLFRFADNVLSGTVKHGYHAVALDERRVDFSPTLWDPDPARIEQALFPGAHADVGGGYPMRGESDLSDGPLHWIIGKLPALEVAIGAETGIAPDPLGIAHQPWASPPFDALGKAARHFPAGMAVHGSVMARKAGGDVPNETAPFMAPYDPTNLPAGYTLV